MPPKIGCDRTTGLCQKRVRYFVSVYAIVPFVVPRLLLSLELFVVRTRIIHALQLHVENAGVCYEYRIEHHCCRCPRSLIRCTRVSA